MMPFKRALLHFPVGLFAVFLLLRVDLALGVVFAISFLVYEAMEDWRIHDKSYLDIYGYLLGLGIGGVIAFLL